MKGVSLADPPLSEEEFLYPLCYQPVPMLVPVVAVGEYCRFIIDIEFRKYVIGLNEKYMLTRE